ncbi:MAG: hypothetical protein IOMNBAOH_02184 [Rhodocyclaceae bacterium]|nr:hypothetical protein [Rhodocyclaceae bacterium]
MVNDPVLTRCAKIDQEVGGELFHGLMLRYLEVATVFPLRLIRALFDRYSNGREPVLQDAASTVRAIVERDVARGTDFWEPLHAVKNVQECLGSLRTVPMPDECEPASRLTYPYPESCS